MEITAYLVYLANTAARASAALDNLVSSASKAADEVSKDTDRIVDDVNTARESVVGTTGGDSLAALTASIDSHR